MQTRLSVEQHSVTVCQVTLNHVTKFELISRFVAVRVLKRNLHDTFVIRVAHIHKVGAGMQVGSISDKLSQFFDIVAVGAFGVCEHLGHQSRYNDFVDSAVRVR